MELRNNTWDDFIHDLKEFLALGFALPCAVFHVADGLLLHPDAPPLLDTPIISAIDACAYHDLISGSLDILKTYRDVTLVKILAGIRRCGKTIILDMLEDDLLGSGIAADHVIHLCYTSEALDDSMTAKQMYLSFIGRLPMQ